jgi:sec-independent protein translocase protein TatA
VELETLTGARDAARARPRSNVMVLQTTTLAFISIPGGPEWIIIAVLGLLIFGKRLPEVGKSLGKSIVEFKKGLKGVEEEIDNAVEGGDQPDMLPPPEQNKADSTESKEEHKETV